MSRMRVLCATGLGAGLGTILGINYGRSSTTKVQGSPCLNCPDGSSNSDHYKSHIYGGLPLPVVSAATSGDLPAFSAPSTVIQPTNRTTEIMRHGFPGFSDVRFYEDFVLSYDRRNKTANWVFEHLTKERVKRIDQVNREENFHEDKNVHPLFRSTNDDYKRSGYDRGHLAAAANHRYSQKAIGETFCLSNISPQVGKGFNRDAWNQLERFVRHLTKSYSNVYVCTGPLYLPRREGDGKLYIKYEVIGQNNVSVPTHFFKVVVMEHGQGSYELLSFVMPNQVLPDTVDLKAYLVPLESIEKAAGLILFEKIPRNTFKKINGK